ncbi:hypothetical protein A2960_05955 [Candidatus Gottesmanbacteria bacterium RIFCSPLOWO2_01_FULL_39_12b]|uniref:AAA+ ATPase domain-containing protein n=1 Tax=Candidatus Gottesmanbacteria bacterium RIFCSPLOWO2_01_FULL_39_12b TaxID=1798388 RepID=A0A1F6AMZ1_9BACT|nr:MAG: hypothetical protein A2960_05955 [Candidatus Gottesmanbacteria bacterium RIFCSPLOWO2_01_FULL_39_12b]
MDNNSPAKIEANYIHRKLEQKVNKYLTLPQIIAVIGPRRSGKTTFLLHLGKTLKNCQYLNFENQKILDLFDLDIESFAQLYVLPNKNLLLDEFQYAKRGGKNLKFLFDSYPKTKIFISGSGSTDLTIKAIKYLVGRVLVFTLLPFDWEEFLLCRNPQLLTIPKNKKTITPPLASEFQKYFEEYLLFGGYPEVVLQNDIEVKKTLLENIYSLYFLKEVKDLISLVDDYKLKNLIKALALQIGNIISYKELSSFSGFEFRSLKRYLNFLEKTFVSFFLLPYFTNKRTELSKNPKVYFFDTGLCNSLLNNFLPLKARQDKGALIENAMAIALNNTGRELRFWRTKNKAEVDFVVESGGKLSGYEVKAGIEEHVPLSLANFIEKYSPDHALVINKTKGSNKKIGATPINFVPYWKPGIV